MKKIFKNKAVLGISLLAMLAPIVSSCSENTETGGTIYIHVLNAEDYMDDELLTGFEESVLEEDGKRVKVIYETYDTNETMYNTLKTGKQTYDLICCSDYMIQRLAREEMIGSLAEFLDDGSLSNYTDYVSPFLADYSGAEAGKLNQIPVQIPNGKDNDGNIIYDETHNLSEYTNKKLNFFLCSEMTKKEYEQKNNYYNNKALSFLEPKAINKKDCFK